MASGIIKPPLFESGLKGTDWTYFRIGERVIAFIYKHFDDITINTNTDASNVYRSGELFVTTLPTFMTVEHYFAGPADGGMTGNVRLHRVFTSNGQFRVYLYADHSFSASADYGLLICCIGTWNGT